MFCFGLGWNLLRLTGFYVCALAPRKTSLAIGRYALQVLLSAVVGKIDLECVLGNSLDTVFRPLWNDPNHSATRHHKTTLVLSTSHRFFERVFVPVYWGKPTADRRRRKKAGFSNKSLPTVAFDIRASPLIYRKGIQSL